MKKFFTLCLAFMLALLYNANAAETGWNTYVSVSPAEGQAVPEWAAVFSGVEDGATYFNSVSYTITAPGADKMEVSVKKNNEEPWSMTLQPNQLPYGNGADEGVWEITATTWKNDESFSTKVNFTVENVSSVYELREFIGTTGKKRFRWENVYVLAQAGEYTYVKDFDRSILIHGQAPTFKAGDVFQEFIAEYHDNNGQHELIPYQFGPVVGNYPQQPEVITIQDVTVANQSKYVKIEDVVLDSKANTLGGIAYYNRFNTEIPVDGTYTITAIIGMNNGSVQLEPLTFEGFVIEPFTYTEIVPANNAEVTSLSEIKITFPYNVTYDATVAMGVLVMDGANMITPQVSVEGAVATLTFDAITAYGSKPSMMVKAGAFKEATSGIGCEQIMVAWSIPTPPVRADYMPINIDPADGSAVEKISNIYFYFDDENPCVTDKGYNAPYKGYVTVKDGNGNAVASDIYLDVKKVSGQWVGLLQPKYGSSYTEPGTYVITLAEGLFSDQQYYDENGKKGRVNPEFTITYTIKSASLAAPTVSPANGAEVESPSTITLTFAESVTVNAEAGALTMVNTSDAAYDYAKNFNVAISEDGLTATITCEPGYPDSAPRWAIGKTYKLNIPAGYFVATSGAASEALEYSWKVVPAPFKVASTTPEVGEVEKLDVIKVYFTENKVYTNIGYSWASLELVDNAGQVVTTGSVAKDGNYVGDVFKSYLVVTLAQPVTTPGQYTLVIPEGYARNVEWGEGAINVATNLTWTVMEPDPNTYNFAWNVNPAEGTVEELKTIVFTAATVGQMLMPTDEAQVANWVKVTDQDGNVYNTTAKAGTGYDVTIEGATAPGTYTVVVPKGSFYDILGSMATPGSKNFNDEIVLTYTLKDAQAVEDFTPVVTPAAGEVTTLEIVNTTIVLPAKFASFDKTIDDYYNEIYIQKPFNKIWSSQLGHVSVSEDGLSINIAWDFTPEVDVEHTLIIPAGYIVLENGAKNLETKVVYTVKAAEVVEDFTPVVSPAAGEITVDQMNETVITFDTPIASFNGNNVRYIKAAGGNVWFFGTSKISEDKLTLTLDWELVKGNYPVGTSYTLDLPTGCIVLENGAKNIETHIDYTIVAPTPDDFTPIVAPAAGDITVDQMDVTVITFESPIASFDNSNVRYIKAAGGNVWLETMGEYTISEDKLTLTFNWNLVKGNYPVGSRYTLDLPAGCIVLENGAKNLETHIDYTIVAPTPDDFSPIVAPAAGNVTAEQIKKTVITLPSKFASFDSSCDPWYDQMYIKRYEFGSEKCFWSKTMGNITVSEDGLTITIDWTNPTFVVGTEYTFCIPAGYIVLENGAKNLATEVAYTLAATALAAPTVSPANDTEVENLNTITLTFAEAVTANAEAGTISIVNTSDSYYDYAKEIRVAISEDGLTATITCVPGYLDRWASGKTYKLNIPAGYFVGTSGAASDALEYSWTIATPKFTYVAVDPAQGEVTELSEILISFAQKTWGNGSNPTLNLVDANGNVVTTASTNREKDANGNWFAIKATLKDKVTTPGTYKLVVPADVFKDTDFGDGVTNAAFDLTWTVTEPDPNTYDLALTSDPANGATVTELKTIKISAADASVIAMPTTEAQSAGWFTIKDAEGNSYNYTAKVGVGIEINIEGATALGTYTVVVPAKSFVDAMTMTAASKRYNAEMVLTYTLQEEEEVDNTVYDLTPVTISPANGTEVETLDVVYVQFPENVYDCLWGALDYSKDFVKVSDDKGNTYEAKLNKGEYSDEYYIYVKDATQPGTYTIVVPKALVFDAEYADTFESGHANPEFTLTYTIVAPQVDDFTPVINPTAGNVTKEQIKTTVLSFESPIASFDDSDVRYAKPAFGSVWCSVAGRYTIAEDKLSLTINWDFSPEVGLDYTLELPAGCIVLENGAKNLFTQVKYTVVGGPKDLAEFVVPEGINGYINYDETDVNAWAPEFPFTVSTSAINTIQFTAELPSLPAGITAMEVIDENGEVIATLNQDGVAPLADGEIYYVKGETTKEYADGAELKFRFRFTHLGVSETIQFSYKVAGGNITSIADVELDGNVIVRGNDIIAPQGAAIFTVSGIRVPAEGLAPGVYVVVLGNQAVKVMVK